MITYIGLLTCMGALVLCEITSVTKCLPTLITYMGLLTCMGAFVYCEMKFPQNYRAKCRGGANSAPPPPPPPPRPLGLRSIKAYLCPNMINSDAVDLSDRRPEEVISFFWCTVYYNGGQFRTSTNQVWLSSTNRHHPQ